MRDLIGISDDSAPAKEVTLKDSNTPVPSANESPISSVTAASCRVGQVYEIPIHELAESPLNARVFYKTSEIDDMALSLAENGQEQTATGYFDDNKIQIIDGVKRLRGARAAGIETLRVEVREKPQSKIAGYLISRRMNTERSNHTSLDDAVRLKQLLDSGEVASQVELAKQAELSEGAISQLLALNRIPQRVMLYMKERPAVCGPALAYQITLLFPKAGEGDVNGTDIVQTEEDLEQRAMAVIDEIVEKGLSVSQAKSLIRGRLAGPKPRAKAQSRAINFQGAKGVLKIFESKRQIDFSLKNVPGDRLDEIRRKIEAIFQE